MTQQPEDPGSATPAGAKRSSFSSSLGAHQSAAGNAGAGSGTAEPSGPGSSGVLDGSASSPSEPAPAADSNSGNAQLADRVSDVGSKVASLSSERPELVIGAAFVGGLVIAMILKRLAR